MSDVQREYGSADVVATVAVMKALLRDRLGVLAAQANDATIDQAAHDAQIAVVALREGGHFGRHSQEGQ